MRDLVTVIVPVYGVESYVARCIDSLVRQSHSTLEIILVDDGSPDQSGTICDEYAATDPRVRVVHQHNTGPGPSGARNVGLDLACGDLVMFVDADDWVHHDLVRRLLFQLQSADVDIAICGFRRVSEMVLSPPAAEAGVRVLGSREALRLYGGPLADMMTAPWGKLYRRELFDGIRFPVGRLYEDEFVTYRVISRARAVALSTAPLYYYFTREGSTTQRRQDNSQLIDRATALQERGDFLRSIELVDTAALSYRKAFLILRLVSRHAQASEERVDSQQLRGELRTLAMAMSHSALPLAFRAFALLYGLTPRLLDRGATIYRAVVPHAASYVGSRQVGSGVGAAVNQRRERALTGAARGARDLEVIVVAYNSPDMLRRTLEAVVPLRVTVVDNSSRADIAALCAELGCRYIDPGMNGGFAAGVNIGLSHRRTPQTDVLLLNPDTVISAEDVGRLHDALLAEPDVASVGPTQVDDLGVPSRVSWPFPSPLRTWLDALGVTRWWGAGPVYVIGSILLLRAEAVVQVGAFDERFFLYSEEADWAYRAHRLGWRHVVVEDVQAVHVGGGTSDDEATRTAHFHGSQERYLRKHHGALGWQLARQGQVLGDGFRSVLRRGALRRRLRARASLYVRGPIRVEASYRDRQQDGAPPAPGRAPHGGGRA